MSKVNLGELKDLAAEHGFGEVMEVRFAGGELGLEQSGLSYHRVKPGRRQAFAHRHATQEEVYLVLEGSGQIKLDDEVVEVGPLDAVKIAPAVARAVAAGDDGIAFIAFGALNGTTARADAEMLQDPGFWD